MSFLSWYRRYIKALASWDQAMEWQRRWGRLARYNAECDAGIVHTPEYDARMAVMRQRYEAEHPGEGEIMGVPYPRGEG